MTYLDLQKVTLVESIGHVLGSSLFEIVRSELEGLSFNLLNCFEDWGVDKCVPD